MKFVFNNPKYVYSIDIFSLNHLPVTLLCSPASDTCYERRFREVHQIREAAVFIN